MLRNPRYVEMVELGLINPAAEPRQVSGRGAVAVIDAQRAPGAVGMNVAARTAMQWLTRTASAGVRFATYHAGAIGYYAQQVAQAGKVAIVMTASKPLMIYHGSKAEGVSTNPIAIAAPTTNPDRPLLLDMSTASVALGKIMAARDAGRSIPPGLGRRREWPLRRGPQKVKAVLPMAGPKGSGLSLMIEIMSSLLVANPIISASLNGAVDPPFNGLVMAIDPRAFGDKEAFIKAVDQLGEDIKGLPPVAEDSDIYLPASADLRSWKSECVKEFRLPLGPCLASLNCNEAVNRNPEFFSIIPSSCGSLNP